MTDSATLKPQSVFKRERTCLRWNHRVTPEHHPQTIIGDSCPKRLPVFACRPITLHQCANLGFLRTELFCRLESRRGRDCADARMIHAEAFSGIRGYGHVSNARRELPCTTSSARLKCSMPNSASRCYHLCRLVTEKMLD